MANPGYVSGVPYRLPDLTSQVRHNRLENFNADSPCGNYPTYHPLCFEQMQRARAELEGSVTVNRAEYEALLAERDRLKHVIFMLQMKLDDLEDGEFDED